MEEVVSERNEIAKRMEEVVSERNEIAKRLHQMIPHLERIFLTDDGDESAQIKIGEKLNRELMKLKENMNMMNEEEIDIQFLNELRLTLHDILRITTARRELTARREYPKMNFGAELNKILMELDIAVMKLDIMDNAIMNLDTIAKKKEELMTKEKLQAQYLTEKEKLKTEYYLLTILFFGTFLLSALFGFLYSY